MLSIAGNEIPPPAINAAPLKFERTTAERRKKSMQNKSDIDKNTAWP